MRPISLSIEGLRSFRSPQTISFVGRDHIAIIGDTGAGKSSILEAMSYALYGRLTYTGSGNKQIMNDVSSMLRVVFEFESSGERWEVTRVLKRAQSGAKAGEVGSPSVALRRIDTNGESIETFGGKADVDDKIEAIVGLDHDAFTTTVVLPQGKFARLLLAEDKIDRRAILKQIWPTDDLEAVGDLADHHLGELRVLKGKLEAKAEGPAGNRDELATKLKDAEAEHARITHTQSEAAAPLDTLERLVNEVRHLKAASDPVAAFDVAPLLELATGISAERDRATAELDEAKADVESTEAKLAAVPSDDDGLPLDQVGQRIDALRQATTKKKELAETVADLSSQHETLVAQITTAGTEVGQTAEALATAETAVSTAQRADAAAHAAVGHSPGDPCPVCDQVLPQSWSPPTATDIEAANNALESALQAQTKSTNLLTKLSTQAEGIATQLEAEKVRLVDATAAFAKLSDVSEADLEARRAELQSRAKTRADLHDQVTKATKRFTTAELALANVGKKVLSTLQTTTATHLAAATTLAMAMDETPVHWTLAEEDLVASITELNAATHDLAQRAADQLETMSSLGAEAKATVHALFEQAKLEPPSSSNQARPTLAAAVATAAHKVGNAAKTLDAYDQAVSGAADAKDALAKLDALILVLSDLKASMTDKAFPGWLAMRRSRGLLASASRLFGEMTTNRYGFADHEEEWLIVDRDTGEARSPASLSGGEKFIASLALALAMVEMVKGTGGKLDALFLDEGFGALDRSNLDAAVQALESVAATGRMVAVITHIAAVAEEVRDVLEVRASPQGSQTRWLSDAERSDTASADESSAIAGLID